jgi:hypothetical protein
MGMVDDGVDDGADDRAGGASDGLGTIVPAGLATLAGAIAGSSIADAVGVRGTGALFSMIGIAGD